MLVDRRIGLLFAVFLLMLLLAAGRASWLGLVRADTLKEAAITQQEHDIEVPARRGTITDANGNELAVSHPAMTVAATPYLIDRPGEAARELADALGKPEDDILEQLVRRDTGFVYVAKKVPVRRAERARKLGIEGLEFIPEYDREYPRTWMASQLLGNVGADGTGLSGLEYGLDAELRGHDGERRLVKDALGDTLELDEVERTENGADVRLTLDAAIQDQTEEVLDEVGETWRPKGATALVMDPDTGAHPRPGELAAGEREQALRGAGLRDDEPRGRPHLRAGLHLQGVHRRRGARGRRGHAGHDVLPAAGAPGRRPRDHRLARRADGSRARRRASSPSPPTSARR